MKYPVLFSPFFFFCFVGLLFPMPPFFSHPLGNLIPHLQDSRALLGPPRLMLDYHPAPHGFDRPRTSYGGVREAETRVLVPQSCRSACCRVGRRPT
ncbi:hypothetical protein GGS23DRAFT_587180 [Durotheca rogersii]|uniref:uncharacterized protein n=1 Tax=Durotheca rogersii TaxID=419775 RepID=UPI00221EF408|nr:uncharacterized protein GGS23DRAFT_587180 [Durotheca rogersii]KAI5858225.1 hypothetical protein GGS23DRAFT_587180 [Durotheca rogersii]